MALNAGGNGIHPCHPTLSLITWMFRLVLQAPGAPPLFILISGAGGTFDTFLGGSMSVNGSAALALRRFTALQARAFPVFPLWT